MYLFLKIYFVDGATYFKIRLIFKVPYRYRTVPRSEIERNRYINIDFDKETLGKSRIRSLNFVDIPDTCTVEALKGKDKKDKKSGTYVCVCSTRFFFYFKEGYGQIDFIYTGNPSETDGR